MVLMVRTCQDVAQRLALVTLLAYISITTASPNPSNTKPFIAILGAPQDEDCVTYVDPQQKLRGSYSPENSSGGGSCIATMYLKWIESAGARVVGIPYNADKQMLDTLLDTVNGILFTGGGLSLMPGKPYYDSALYIFNKAIEKNKQGIHFPIHGTCMGFQLLSILAANDSSVLVPGFDSEDYSVPLHVTPFASTSRIFGNAPAQIMQILTTQNVTSNLHHSGVTPKTYATNQRLASFYNVLSTNKDRKGREFVSTIEAKEYPIRGTQWHPERPQFEWSSADNFNQTPDSILAMQYMANFFVTEARRNSQSIQNQEAQNLIEKYIVYGMQTIAMSNDALDGFRSVVF